MPFAEPRPHRRPFHAQKDGALVVAPKLGNLALTSLTVSNQDFEPHFVQVESTKGSNRKQLLMVLVPGGATLHFPFPHPIMVGAGRSLVVNDMSPTAALVPVTVVGYEWRPADDKST
jgi:hypothetical protein